MRVARYITEYTLNLKEALEDMNDLKWKNGMLHGWGGKEAQLKKGYDLEKRKKVFSVGEKFSDYVWGFSE